MVDCEWLPICNCEERGYDLIMAAGSQFDEAANKVASNVFSIYPSIKQK